MPIKLPPHLDPDLVPVAVPDVNGILPRVTEMQSIIARLRTFQAEAEDELHELADRLKKAAARRAS